MLAKYFHELADTGEAGFEGVIRKLLIEQTGFEFRLSRTGSQYGRDARAKAAQSGSVMFECKNYRKVDFDERELIAEFDQAIGDDRLLDIWILAASKPIPDQLSTQLGKKAAREHVDFLGLDCGLPNQPESLDYLAAASPDVLLDALTKKGVDAKTIADAKQSMSSIAASAGFSKRIENIRQQLIAPSLGWPTWRNEAAKQWLTCLADEHDSRARFGQPLHLLSPSSHNVLRKKATAALDKWWQQWSKKTSFFAMLGDEGDGKTWSVAQWLTVNLQKDTNFPPVIFLSSIDARGSGSLEELILLKLETEFGTQNWKERLQRWRSSKGSHGDGPLAVVVLDGLNERQTPEFWRAVLDSAAAPAWKESLAVICTARTRYWNEFFKPLPYWQVTNHAISPYDDDELKQALSARKQNLDEYPSTLHPLLRKPRYLDLAVKHREQLKARGDFTIARLIYEDWRDRYQRKTACPMSEEQFNDLLTGMGKDFLAGQEQWDPQAITERLALTEDKVSAFRELSTGDILNKTAGTWQIQPGPLSLGLGMLLCSQLQQSGREGKALSEVIASWIEPYSGVDLQSRILELAALHSLMTEHSSSIRIELLSAWLGTQNPDSTLEESVIRRFTAYLPENSDTYFDLAEKIWSSGCDNPWAQELLLRGFIGWAHTAQHVIDVLPARFQRWLGMIPKNGLPIFRRSDDAGEEVRKIRQQLISLFGESALVDSDTVSLEGYNFVLIEDDGWLRLARVALAIISTFDDRRRFLPQIVTAMIADSVFSDDFNYPEKMDLLQWVLRSSKTDLSSALLTLATPLLNSTSLPCKRAAARLCTSVGTKLGWNQWEALDQDALFPTPEWVKKQQENLFDSLFAVPTVALEAYPEQDDFKPWNFLEKARWCVTQRTFAPRGDVSALLLPVFDRFEGKTLWNDSGLSSEEHFLNQYQPVLARYCPSRLCDLLRANFTAALQRSVSADNKSGLLQKLRHLFSTVFGSNVSNASASSKLTSLLYLRFEINKHDLLLRDAERQLLELAWRANQRQLLNSDTDHQYTESLIFQAILPRWTAQQQLTELLHRSDKAFELATYPVCFCAYDSITFQEPMSMHAWLRSLHFLAATKRGPLSGSQIKSCLDSKNPKLQSAILKYLSACATADDIKEYFLKAWHWQAGMTFAEQEYGAYLLISHADGDIDDLIEVVPPTRRGTLLVKRGANNQQMSEYTRWLDAALTKMINFEIPEDFPKIKIDYYSALPAPPHPVSVIHDEESQRIRFVSPESVWGGRLSTDFPDFDRDIEKLNKIWKGRNETLERVTHEGAAAGHHWVSNIFHPEGLVEAIDNEPGIVDTWLAKALDSRTLYQAGSFYQALCEALFETPHCHEDACNLYRALKREGRFTHIVVPHMSFLYLDLVVARSSRTAEIEKLWLEKYNSCTSDKDLLELAIQLRFTPNSEAGSWFKNHLEREMRSGIPYNQARSYGLLGFLEEDPQAAWLLESIPKDTYWLKDVQRIAQERFSDGVDCRFWFNKFCAEPDTDQAWCAFQLFLSCADRRCWLWLDLEITANSAEKVRFVELNRHSIERACKENEKELDEKFLDCKVDLNLSPWLPFSKPATSAL